MLGIRDAGDILMELKFVHLHVLISQENLISVSFVYLLILCTGLNLDPPPP